jgi:hypothetical protein
LTALREPRVQIVLTARDYILVVCGKQINQYRATCGRA